MALKIAIAGKGGTGKTTVSALLCKALIDAAQKPLLAVDADPNSCLPERLGLSSAKITTIGNLREQLRANPDQVPQGISKSEWIERLINEEVTEAVGFDLIVMGRQEGPNCYCYINNLLRNCMERTEEHYKAIIIDNEAGLEHLSRRTNGKVDIMLVVCQPTLSGARTAVRIVEIIKNLDIKVSQLYLVMNLDNGQMQNDLRAEFDKCGLEIAGSIPHDPAVAGFEVEGKSLIELPSDSQALKAVGKLLNVILERRKK